MDLQIIQKILQRRKEVRIFLVDEHAKNIENTQKIIDFENKKMILLTNRELKSHEDARVCYICRKYFLKKLAEDINHRKVGDHCHYSGKYRGAVHSICNLKFHVPNEIPVVFHNDSKYNNHFIIKNLANEFEGQFECIDENNEK